MLSRKANSLANPHLFSRLLADSKHITRNFPLLQASVSSLHLTNKNSTLNQALGEKLTMQTKFTNKTSLTS